MGCVFCAIASGDIPSHKVYEDKDTFAFLDIAPLRPGHTLVISKEHAGAVEDLANPGALLNAAAKIIPKLNAAVACQDATLAIHNGPAAGQEVPHVHLHIVPRAPGDGGGPIHSMFENRPALDGNSLAELAQEIA